MPHDWLTRPGERQRFWGKCRKLSIFGKHNNDNSDAMCKSTPLRSPPAAAHPRSCHQQATRGAARPEGRPGGPGGGLQKADACGGPGAGLPAGLRGAPGAGRVQPSLSAPAGLPLFSITPAAAPAPASAGARPASPPWNVPAPGLQPRPWPGTPPVSAGSLAQDLPQGPQSGARRACSAARHAYMPGTGEPLPG
jgi:hypothetical protein